MKTLIYILATFLTFTCYAQTFQDYYVVVKENKSIEPNQKTILSDGSLELTFSQEELHTFFNNVSTYKYEKEFEVSPEITKKYKLEVITEDGFKRLFGS